jgi:ABC-type multidrug transport system fused ATPase/permease subunit
MIMVLFSGFIQPKPLIPPGWVWFYWLNPLSWAIKAVSINEFKSPKYDFLTCTNPSCTEKARFGDYILEQYGNPTDENYIWYSLAVMFGEFVVLYFLAFLGLKYLRVEVAPLPPSRTKEYDSTKSDRFVSNDQATEEAIKTNSLPFDPVTFAFKNISYTVTLPSKEEKMLLKGVDGFVEPGNMIALMGSSGAGKTTLLDVISGRKNTGVVEGNIYLNGKPKVENQFRRITGYVEQFDSLSEKSTAREVITFSAALRLASSITE